MRLAALFIASAAIISAQTAVFPGAVATTNELPLAKNHVQTALSAVMNPSDTAMTVVGGGGIIPNMLVNIDNETMFVCNVVGNTVYVGHSACPNADGRGFDNSTPATHKADALVSGYINAWNVNASNDEIIAIETALGPNLSSFTPLVGTSLNIKIETAFSGSDCGARINAAYLALPSQGGYILVPESCSFSTPINFNSASKAVMLVGYGNSTTMTYTPSTGTAITFNNGIAFDFSSTLLNITLTGSGSANGSIGLMLGGSNGAVGFTATRFKIQTFGTGIQTASHTWVTKFDHGMVRDCSRLVLMPSGQTQAGENVEFDHVVFADAPTPHTNSVWIQGGGQEIVFHSCSFDQAQLRVGNGGTSSAQVAVTDSWFENPDWISAGAVDYDYVVVDNNNGNYLRLGDDYFLQDRTTAVPYARILNLAGGRVDLHGIGMFTPALAPLTNFALLSNAVNITSFGFNDLSGNISGTLWGGATTGCVTSFPGVNTGSVTGYNNIIGCGDAVGGAAFDVQGNIRARNGQLVSTVSTGTAPLVVNSSSPVQNLAAQPIAYSSSGTQKVGLHMVMASSTLGGGGTLAVTLSNAAVFSATNTYFCTATDTATASAIKIAHTSSTVVTFTGPANDTFDWTCTGS